MDSGRNRVPKETASKDQWVGLDRGAMSDGKQLLLFVLLHLIVCVP